MISKRLVQINALTLMLILNPVMPAHHGFNNAVYANTKHVAILTYLLKEGTEVGLKFAEDLSSKTATVDDRVNFLLEEDLKVGDVVVAKAGSKAVGSVTHVKKAGMLGKGGELNIRLEYLKTTENRIRLRANKGKEGEGKEGTMILLTVLFGPLGLIKKGKNIEVKAGTPLKAYVDEGIKLPVDR